MDEIIHYLNDERERNKTVDFIQFAKEWISNTETKGVKNYKCALNALIRYLNMGFLNKEREVRVQALKESDKRVPSNRAVSLYMGSIRHLFNEAKKFYNDYDRNIILVSNSPFENFKVPKQEVTRKRAIVPELLRKIWGSPYKYTAKGRESNSRYHSV